MNIEPSVVYKLIWSISFMAVVIAAVISAISHGIQSWLDRVAADRRQMREIIMKGALENWKVVDQAAKESHGTRWPLDVYLVHMHKFSEVLALKKITVEALRKNDGEAEILIKEALRIAERVTKDAMQRQPGQEAEGQGEQRN